MNIPEELLRACMDYCRAERDVWDAPMGKPYDTGISSDNYARLLQRKASLHRRLMQAFDKYPMVRL